MDYSFKRIFDLSLASIGITLSLPLWFLFAFLIWIEDRKPIFYTQERIGKNGKIFKIIKFRTMNSNKEINTPLAKLLRRTALDELPQLMNILKGEMSFVGPRPLAREEMAEFERTKYFEERMGILPGLTGITQVLLPKNATQEEKFSYDTWYIKNCNLILDIKLILISCLITFLGRWDVNIDKIGILNKLKKTNNYA